VGLTQILGDQVATSFVNILLFANDFDASSTTGSGRLHNVHVLVPLYFSLSTPPFVVLRENVCGGADVVVLAVVPLHAENVSPQVVLSAKLPAPREMVYFLVLAYKFKLAWPNNAGPQHVPGGTDYQSKSSSL